MLRGRSIDGVSASGCGAEGRGPMVRHSVTFRAASRGRLERKRLRSRRRRTGRDACAPLFAAIAGAPGAHRWWRRGDAGACVLRPTPALPRRALPHPAVRTAWGLTTSGRARIGSAPAGSAIALRSTTAGRPRATLGPSRAAPCQRMQPVARCTALPLTRSFVINLLKVIRVEPKFRGMNVAVTASTGRRSLPSPGCIWSRP